MKLKIDTIDSHMHLEKWFDEVGRNYFDIFDSVQEITGAKALCINAMPITRGVENNIMAAFYKIHNPTAYANAGFVYPEFPSVVPFPLGLDSLTQYKELMDIGFDGFKIIYKPNYQNRIGININSEFYEDFFAQAEKNNINILWHLADPEDCWYENGVHKDSNKYLSNKEMFAHTIDVLERHPDLNVTFAHFMFLSNYPDVLEKIFDKYKNVSVDITPGAEMYVAFTKNREYFRNFFTKYSDRIIFGSDNQLPWDEEAHYYFRQFDERVVYGSKSELSPSAISSDVFITAIYDAIASGKDDIDMLRLKVKGLNLSQDICEKILSKNYINKCHGAPKKINVDALKKYIEKYEKYIWSPENKNLILRYIKTLR